MLETNMYRTGIPNNPQRGDRTFTSAEEAEAAALLAAGDREVIAIWTGPDDGDRIIGLAFQGQVFR